jgi:streptogramin lyase
LPNPNHYSASLWYKLQGFSGSPQSILVDGYEAVRDGRSVYVNAANVQDGKLYTNIYLISFNQEAEGATMDIFAQILDRWKFNTNYIITDSCSESSDVSCLHTDDCPIGEYCLSAKAKMIRDTKRLSDLAEMKILIGNYLDERGYYPILQSGSYLSHITTSAWPSWQKLFAQHLGQELAVDPLNKMGDCGDPRFEEKTCWDFAAQEFADSNPGNDEFDLPEDSYVYVYTANADGSSYKLYANLEEGYGASIANGLFDGEVTGLLGNTAPKFSGEVLKGSSGEEFSGFIRVEDDGLMENLTVTIDTSSTVWTAWSAPPEIQLVASVPSQRRIYAAAAGNPGNYFFDATVSDDKGLSVTKTFMIVILNDSPKINLFDVSYLASTTKPFDVTFIAKDFVSNYPLTYNVNPNGAYGLNPATFNLNTDGDAYNLNINGFFDPNTQSPIDPSRTYNYVVTVTDKFGVSNNDNFQIKVLNNKPNVVLPIPCDTDVRVENDYNSCSILARDQDGHAISGFIFSSLPNGMESNSAGLIYGKPKFAEAGVYNVSIRARDEFGAVSEEVNYALSVNTYCGDGVKQGPGESPAQNMEEKGGPNNDGREDCDGLSGLSFSVANSSVDRMYACTTPDLLTCPVDGDCSNTCTFVTGPNGGYCGDSIAQDGNNGSTDFGEECDDGMDDSSASGTDECDTRNVNGYGFCAFTFCGDGVTQNPNGLGTAGASGTGDEECDDFQNGDDTDQCYDDCSYTYCNDGIIQVPNGRGTGGANGIGDEECDDGSLNSITSPCAPDCTLTYCGDGIMQLQNGVSSMGAHDTGDEQCDDGNLNDNDLCSNDCRTCNGIADIYFAGTGVNDALVYDNNNNPNTVANVSGGSYLKLNSSLPTPYIWVANSNLNSITKVRAYTGPKRQCERLSSGVYCYNNKVVTEIKGKSYGTFLIRYGAYTCGNPSRTAVNVETGDVWVACRDTGDVFKLDINGNVLKRCATGGGPRGVAIEEGGDVWVANYASSNVVKIPGDDNSCTILKTINVGGNPYGLAIDSKDNVWISNRGADKIQRINASNYSVSNWFADNIYGITVDLNDNAVVAGLGGRIYRVNVSTGSLQNIPISSYSRPRGVSIDINGNYWMGLDNSNRVARIMKSNLSAQATWATGGVFPIGVAGDSMGNMWAINHNSGNVSSFNLNGTLTGVYNPLPASSNPYTYSDMTGLNRAMIFRKGFWINNTIGFFDSGLIGQRWGKISWQEIIPSSRQKINVQLRADDVKPSVNSWVDASVWNTWDSNSREGRYLEIKVELSSKETGVTPVLWNLSITCP